MVPLMHHDADRPCITDPDPVHPKGTHSKAYIEYKLSYPSSSLGIDYHVWVDIY